MSSRLSGYTGWTPAPGNESRVAAKGPHGDEVQILLDPTAEQGLASGGDRWPLGSIIAKDIFQDGKLVQIAAMKKTAKGWYWGEWDAQGKPVVEGLAAEPCEGCHKTAPMARSGSPSSSGSARSNVLGMSRREPAHWLILPCGALLNTFVRRCQAAFA